MKEFKTLEQQINRLKEHNIIIDDEQLAKDVLSSVNYYKISGYWYHFADSFHEKCIIPKHFYEIYDLYLFDMEFKSCIMWIIGHLEIKIRRCIAYKFAQKYGGLGYKNINNFNMNWDDVQYNFDKLQESIDFEIDHNKNHPAIRHHLKNKSGQFPIWVIVEFLSFGSIVRFYKLLKNEDKTIISNEFNSLVWPFSQYISAIREIRNICAHFNRLYNLDLINFRNIDGTKIYNRLVLIKKMLNNDKFWSMFIEQLHIVFHKHSYVDLNCIGFPDDWKDKLK